MRARTIISTTIVTLYALLVLGSLLLVRQDLDCEDAGEILRRPSQLRAGQCEIQLHNGQWARYDELNIHVSKR